MFFGSHIFALLGGYSKLFLALTSTNYWPDNCVNHTMPLLEFHCIERQRLREPCGKLINIAKAGTVSSVALSELQQAFLFEKARLIAPPGKGDIHSPVGAFRISRIPHYIRQASVAHQHGDPKEQLENVPFPEIGIPGSGLVIAAEAVELQNSIAYLMLNVETHRQLTVKSLHFLI